MKKVKANLLIKYTIEGYKTGYAYKLEMFQYEIDRLLRRGCIYASESAKYYKEEVKVEEVKEAKKPRAKKNKVEDNVLTENVEQTKVQEDDASEHKLKE